MGGGGKAAGAARVVILGNIESVVKEKCMINIILKTEMHSFLIIIWAKMNCCRRNYVDFLTFKLSTAEKIYSGNIFYPPFWGPLKIPAA